MVELSAASRLSGTAPRVLMPPLSAAVRIRVNPALAKKPAWNLPLSASHSEPSFDQKPTAAWQTPVNAAAAEGGGRRPACVLGMPSSLGVKVPCAT